MCLYLPRYHRRGRTRPTRPRRADAGEPAHGETVLVVDDEPTVRMLIVEVLEEAGYRVARGGGRPVGPEDPAVRRAASTC